MIQYLWRSLRSPVVLFGLGAFAAVSVLAWHDYRTTAEWRKSSELLLSRRADEALELLSTAFIRDMRAAQMQVLATFSVSDLTEPRIHEVESDAANAFAKFPYIESLFVWRRGAAPVVFFHRADRRPRWAGEASSRLAFPVDVVEGGSEPTGFAARILEASNAGYRFFVFGTQLAGEPYQAVVHYLYDDELRASAVGAVGCSVNQAWARTHYFPDLARQVAHIIDADQELTIRIADASGHDVTRVGPSPIVGSTRQRQLPLLFADPSTVDRDARSGVADAMGLEVGIKADSTRDAAFRSAERMATFTAVAAVALAMGFIMTARAVRDQAKLSELRSDFVSTVTHNLKTPIASIRILGEALARTGSAPATADAGEYGVMLVQETQQLSRLVDNLLAYSRVSDLSAAYTFEPLPIDSLVEKALAGFRQRLLVDNFSVRVNIPDDLPEVRADATAIGLVLVNIIDNAIRYSSDRKCVEITGERVDSLVSLSIADRGDGIPVNEIQRVGRKFFRGGQARSDGSGLGLALSQQIVRDHDGALRVTSTVGEGTRVTIDLPVM